jgi:hypothetical protein
MELGNGTVLPTGAILVVSNTSIRCKRFLPVSVAHNTFRFGGPCDAVYQCQVRQQGGLNQTAPPRRLIRSGKARCAANISEAISSYQKALNIARQEPACRFLRKRLQMLLEPANHAW